MYPTKSFTPLPLHTRLLCHVPLFMPPPSTPSALFLLLLAAGDHVLGKTTKLKRLLGDCRLALQVVLASHARHRVLCRSSPHMRQFPFPEFLCLELRLSETEIRIPPNNGELLKFGGAHSTPLPTAGLPGEGEDALIVGAREFNGGEGEGEEVQPVEAVFTNVVPEPVDDVLDGAMRLVVVREFLHQFQVDFPLYFDVRLYIQSIVDLLHSRLLLNGDLRFLRRCERCVRIAISRNVAVTRSTDSRSGTGASRPSIRSRIRLDRRRSDTHLVVVTVAAVFQSQHRMQMNQLMVGSVVVLIVVIVDVVVVVVVVVVAEEVVFVVKRVPEVLDLTRAIVDLVDEFDCVKWIAVLLLQHLFEEGRGSRGQESSSNADFLLDSTIRNLHLVFHELGEAAANVLSSQGEVGDAGHFTGLPPLAVNRSHRITFRR